MGIIDTIKGFFATREKSKDADVAIAAVKAAISSQNYNQASLKAYYALEKIGEVYVNTPREEHMTIREYAGQLSDTGIVTLEQLEPILLNFEIAKYSEGTVDIDSIATVEQTLDTVVSSFKSGSVQKTSSKGGSKRKRRRKPRKSGKTGAARRRKSRSSDK